jgi:hypothetical protein
VAEDAWLPRGQFLMLADRQEGQPARIGHPLVPEDRPARGLGRPEDLAPIEVEPLDFLTAGVMAAGSPLALPSLPCFARFPRLDSTRSAAASACGTSRRSKYHRR